MSFCHFEEINDICGYETEKDMLFDKEISLKEVTMTKNIQKSKTHIPSSTNLSKNEEAKEPSLV